MGKENTVDREPLKLLLAAGGTGGHVIPGIVVAREFAQRDPGRRVLFVGTARGIESRLIPGAGFPLELLEVGALQGQSAAARLQTLLALPRALMRAASILRGFQPNVVLGIGGYAAGPVMLAAAFMGVPLAVLEPNAFPGLANRWVAPYVSRAFLEFEEAARFFRAGSSIVTGVPVREEFFAVPPRRHAPPYTVLVFGGSQGARTLNRAVMEALPLLAEERRAGKLDLALLHQTGQSEYNRVREEAAKYDLPADIFPFRDRLWEAFAQADVVVCRSGANTVAELGAAGRAAVLAPFPAAANQHQLRNAEAVVKLGGARLVPDAEMSGAKLVAVLRELLSDPERLTRMERAIRRVAHRDAARRIVDEIERMARRRAGTRF